MSLKTVALLQSSYIPWKGYFDLINMVDEFILYDTVQYTKNDWRNRNVIKTDMGIQWLTIPIKTSGNFGQRVCDAIVCDHRWIKKHGASLRTYYAKAQYFNDYYPLIESAFNECLNINHLSHINYIFLKKICEILGITTVIKWSSDYSYETTEDKTRNILNICKEAKATGYISGPSAASYINTRYFQEEKIELSYIDYSNYPIHKQLYDNFLHQVSVLDLIFNEGVSAKNFMKSF